MSSVTPKPDLTESEIIQAIENEGYPFEIRVFERYRELQLDPVFGERVPTGVEDVTRDTDVIGFREVSIPREGGRSNVLFQLVTEAKKLHGSAFVGFVAGESDERAVQNMRLVIGGAPSFEVLPEYRQHDLVHPNAEAYGVGISQALTPLLRDVPVCVQWGLPRRRLNNIKEKGEFMADHDQGTFDDLIGATRTAHYLLRNASETMISQTKDSAVYQIFALPVLALDGPLYTYDASTKKLDRVHHLALQICSDGYTGTRRSIIDVVDLDGLTSLVARVEECVRIATSVLGNKDYAFGLAVTSVAQKRRWEEEDTRRRTSTTTVRFRPAGEF